jgi:hypothetical protein
MMRQGRRRNSSIVARGSVLFAGGAGAPTAAPALPAALEVR